MATHRLRSTITLATKSKIPIRNLWYLLLYAWGDISLKGRWAAEVEQAPTLDALLALVLKRLLEQRLRIGLGRDYVIDDAFLHRIRGRIDVTASLRANSFARGEAYCHYQEFSVDAPKNQIVRSTLLRLQQSGEFGPDNDFARVLHQSLGRLIRNLDAVALIEVSPHNIYHQQLGRNENDYRLMLRICELVLRRQMPLENGVDRHAPVLDWDNYILHRVYERFVANFYKHHLRHWAVESQKPLAFPAEPTSPNLPGMRVDISLVSPKTGKVTILDTKFTSGSLVQPQYGGLRLASSHLYQMYAYLRTQEEVSYNHRSARGILLYPQAEHTVHERIKIQGHWIWFETVDLSARWEQIEERLLALADETGDTD